METKDWIKMSQYMQDIRLFSRTVIHRTQKEIKLTAQQVDLLSQLIINKKMTPLNLANKMGVSKTIISRIVDQLYQEEYIVKEAMLNDKRSYNILITKKGEDALAKIYKLYLGPIYELREKMGKDFNKLVNLIEEANLKMNVEVENDVL